MRKWIDKLRQQVSNLNNGRLTNKNTIDTLQSKNNDINNIEQKIKEFLLL
jgi:hypothetical protein